MLAVALLCTFAGSADVVRVHDLEGFRDAVARARPGTQILLAPGDYRGGVHLSEIRGAAGKPIVIGAADPARPPRFLGGGSGLQFSDVSHLVIRDLEIVRPTQDGLNVDDGGSYGTPTHHLTLKNLKISELPQGNHDGIKLSGVDDFRVENCQIQRWGGSGIDMVGCHRGTVEDCAFGTGGDSGVQAKGGSSEISIRRCRFDEYGQRGVNIGGSTGVPFFRPPLEKMPKGRRYEAKDIRVEGCTFTGGVAPFAFVGVDGATVRFNTIYHPDRWAMRILQETDDPDFVPSRGGVFRDNLVIFRSTNWSEGGVNIGPGTAPKSFRFQRNFWFCSDRPAASEPKLPTLETDAVIGRDPRVRFPSHLSFGVEEGSPAATFGAHALPRKTP
ncbi:MAG: right-handed parallel beta-helix repeat-containing protein [Fimbriimonas sp.]